MRRLIALILLIASGPVLAVTTSHWTQSNEADFKSGTFHNVVATNLGDLKLSRAVHTLLEQDQRIGAVYSLAEAKDGTIYAGTGPQGVLLQIKGEKVSTAATLEDGTSIFSLLIDHNGSVLMGTGGQKGRILRLSKPGERPQEIFSADGVQYIWAMVQTSDGNIYAATGPSGQLFEIKKDGSHSILLDSQQNNLLCMASDGGDLLYVGTDPDGLVYRVNRKTRESFVLYDAAESEISALALDGKGNLYVGTAAVSDQAQGAQETSAADRGGRPEGNSSGTPIQAQPPTNPQPPAVPNPNPGQPPPIPQTQPSVQKMMLLDDPDPGQDPGNPPGEPTPPGNPNPPNSSAPASAKPATTATQPQAGAPAPAQPQAAGNAIYKIDANGFVSEVFREQVLVYSIVVQGQSLLVGTGSDGLVYQVNPVEDETVVIAKVDPQQVTTLLPTQDGRIIMGLANVGALAVMGSGFASEGTYTSPALDATQISQVGKLQMHGTLPAGTSVSVSSRSGNVKDATESSWSKWADEQPAAEFVQTNSPPARFFQYRLTFTTKDDTESPVVSDVDVAYLMPNLAPQVKAIRVTLGSKTAPPPPPAADQEQNAAATPAIPIGRIQTIGWDASDPNDDPLIFSLYFRTGAGGPWILLKDKLKDSTYEWDTRSVPDGRYEIKVVASDEAANPVGLGKTASRISDPVLVDNTPPIVGDIKTQVQGTQVKVTLRAVDRTSTVAAVDYAVDSATDWQAATPVDKMFDAPAAPATFTVTGLSSGAHQITVRATDARGNQGFESVLISIEASAGHR